MNLNQRLESLAARLAVAYEARRAALESYFKACDETTRLKKAHVEAQQAVLTKYAADPKALGSNEETRKARVAELTTLQRRDVVAAEDDERSSKNKLELANVEVDDALAQLEVVKLIACVTPLAPVVVAQAQELEVMA